MDTFWSIRPCVRKWLPTWKRVSGIHSLSCRGESRSIASKPSKIETKIAYISMALEQKWFFCDMLENPRLSSRERSLLICFARSKEIKIKLRYKHKTYKRRHVQIGKKSTPPFPDFPLYLWCIGLRIKKERAIAFPVVYRTLKMLVWFRKTY